MEYKRFILGKLIDALEDTPIVFVTGPRQAGKSTLVQMVRAKRKQANYLTLDDLTHLSAAQKNPQGWLETGHSPLIIDEIQRAPELFLPLKYLVDQDRKPGRYLLTSSSNILLLPKLADSLAGRMEILYLLPLSRGELARKNLPIISLLFDDPTALPKGGPKLRNQTLDWILEGGYPEAVSRKNYDRRMSWFDSYVTTILQRDVKEIANIEGVTRLPHLLKILASRSGGLLNLSELSRTSGLATTTLKRYFTLLQTVFLIHSIPAWANNLGKRLVKSPKVYPNDTGLLCYLLGADKVALETDPALLGKAVETYVANELLKLTTYSLPKVSLHHYRTTTGIEVDFILEKRNGQTVAIEVKASQTVSHGDFKGIQYFAKSHPNHFVNGLVYYLGNEIIPFGPNLYAVPIAFH